MALFKFTAINSQGYEEVGTVEAGSQDEAMIKLRMEYRIVSEIKEFKEKEDFRDTLNIRKLDLKKLTLLSQQISIILKAGMPIVKTLEMTAAQTEDKHLKAMIKGVAEDVSTGMGVADAFQKREPNLPVTFIETIRAGEESGTLDDSFEKMYVYLGKKASTKDKVVSALTYPLLVIAVAIVVIAIIMIVAIPKFTTAFASLGTELPLPTRMIIALSGFFTHAWWIILIIIVGLIVGLKVFERDPANKAYTDSIRLKLPIIGSVNKMNACSEFANTLSTMLSAGLPAIRAIEITAKAISNSYIGSKIAEVTSDLSTGMRIADSVRSKQVFPPLLTEMVAVGEETGEIEQTLRVVGDYYDNEVDIVTSRATKLLEPCIIAVLAVFVVLILLAVYAPMFSMYDSM